MLNIEKIEKKVTANCNIFVTTCDCGAITVTIDSKEFAFKPLNDIEKQKALNLSQEEIQYYYSCNHCVNHWGIDLCSCGSGLDPEECTETKYCKGDPNCVGVVC